MANGFYPENSKLGEVLQTSCTNGTQVDKGYIAHYPVGTYQPGATGIATGMPATVNVPAGTATDIMPATANALQLNVSTFTAQPNCPRSVILTPGGTTANVTAVQAVITGTDINDQTLTETLPAFTAGAATAVESVGAFKTITNITIPANGTAVTVSAGFGAKLGLPDYLPHNTVLAAVLNGVREATAPTVNASTTILAQNTCKLNSALSGTPVDIYYIA